MNQSALNRCRCLLRVSLVAFAAIQCMAICRFAMAQDSSQRLDRTIDLLQRQTQVQVDTDLPPSQRALFDYGAYATYGYLSFDDPAHNNHGANDFELVGYGLLNLDGANEFYVRGRGTYLDYNPGDSPNNEPNHVDGVFEEAWYSFDLANFEQAHRGQAPPVDVYFKGGRQFVDWGIGMTLDQYVDGMTARIKTKYADLDLLAGVTIRQTVDFDTSRPDFDESTERGFYGAKLTVPVGRQNPYAYILIEQDYNRTEPLDIHVIPTRYQYNSYYAGLGMSGPIRDHFTYAAEFCFEGGHDLSNSYNSITSAPVSQTYDAIEAYAGDFRINYLPGDSRRSQLGLEAMISSGDRDRINTSATFGGNRANTDDHAFNALGNSNTGLAFGAQFSNLMLLRLSASTCPFPGGVFKDLQVGADFQVFGKTEVHAPIDEPTNNNSYLGCEPDLSVNWRVTEDVTCMVRYGLFVPGPAIPAGQPDFLRQFLYAAVTYAF